MGCIAGWTTVQNAAASFDKPLNNVKVSVLHMPFTTFVVVLEEAAFGKGPKGLLVGVE